MNSEINSKLQLISKKRAEDNRVLPEGISDVEAKNFLISCVAELAQEPPAAYVEFLKVHNGLTVEGVFIYSTQRLPISGSTGKTLAFIEMNEISRELDELKGFLVFGDSDQDEYVLDLSTKKYQARDKQAFDNIYEEFNDFDDLLEFMLYMIIKRIS